MDEEKVPDINVVDGRAEAHGGEDVPFACVLKLAGVADFGEAGIHPDVLGFALEGENGNKIYSKEVTTNKLPKGLKGNDEIMDEFERFEEEFYE